MKKIIFLSIISIVLSISCKKDAETDTEAPVITITSPTEGQAFNAADSVTLSFTATDADFHGYDYVLINTTLNDTIDEDDQHTHANITFSKKYLLPAASNFKFTVGAEDHNGNASSKSVDFKTN